MHAFKSHLGKRLAPAVLILIAACTSVSSLPDNELTRASNPLTADSPKGQGRQLKGAKDSKTASGRKRTTVDSFRVGDDLGTEVTGLVAELDESAVGDAPLTMDMAGTFGMTGVEAHAVTVKAKSLAVMSDQPDSVEVADSTTGNSRIYSADQAYQSYTIQDGKQQVKITVNPDGTYGVDGKPARNDTEAATLALASPVVAGASIQGLSALYILLQNERKATRAPICIVNCSGPNVMAFNDTWSRPTNLAYAIIKAKLKADKK